MFRSGYADSAVTFILFIVRNSNRICCLRNLDVLGIENAQHREDIWREIMKLRLKGDILYIRDLERRVNTNFD
ncbi:hypothetical protein B566_EDAN002725 [Ephemera danica]|nr:hypothetical protein B566_EDAN002725 [Ephemera danica]